MGLLLSSVSKRGKSRATEWQASLHRLPGSPNAGATAAVRASISLRHASAATVVAWVCVGVCVGG